MYLIIRLSVCVCVYQPRPSLLYSGDDVEFEVPRSSVAYVAGRDVFIFETWSTAVPRSAHLDARGRLPYVDRQTDRRTDHGCAQAEHEYKSIAFAGPNCMGEINQTSIGSNA